MTTLAVGVAPRSPRGLPSTQWTELRPGYDAISPRKTPARRLSAGVRQASIRQASVGKAVSDKAVSGKLAPDELIPLTGASPRAALAAARAVLAGRPGQREASIAHQAAAIVLRDFGDVAAAIREFRLAARLARAAHDPEREADVLTSLGTALVIAGRTEAGLAVLDQARADLDQAIALTGQAGEVIWQARALTAAALADLAVGAVEAARAGLAAAERLFAGSGQQLEIAYTRHNLGLVAFADGDLPGALRQLDDAAGRYAGLGVFVPDVALDRGSVLLAAGPADALAGVEAALDGGPAASKKAELMLIAARIALAAGRNDQSAERARLARTMFTRQHRPWWRDHATLVLLEARFLAGRPPARLLAEAQSTADRLSELRSDEAPGAWPRRCGPKRPGTGGVCWPPAAGDSGFSRSTWARWARRSCARTPPRTAPSWPDLPSGPRSGPAGRACCLPGASAGVPYRCGRRDRRPPIPELRPSSPRSAT